MKHWIISLLIGVAMLVGRPAIAGRCTGKAACNACTNCSSCKYCNEGGGTCGKCNSHDMLGKSGSFWSSKWPWIISCGVLVFVLFNNRKKNN